MKKGLLTVLLASLVLVGCQNYDDQFDDLNAQISALKSQVDGISALSSQVASISGTISGLQAGISAAQAAATAAGASADAATAAANGIDLSGLTAGVAAAQAAATAAGASADAATAGATANATAIAAATAAATAAGASADGATAAATANAAAIAAATAAATAAGASADAATAAATAATTAATEAVAAGATNATAIAAATAAATAAGVSADAATAAATAATTAATAASTAATAASTAATGLDLSGLSTSLATLQTEVDAIQASLATAATASAVAALQTELDAIEADVNELVAGSNVYNQSLTISNASTLDAAFALGNNLNIVNGSVTITQTTTMDAVKLQTIIDKIFTVTGAYSYTASAATVTAMTFDKLASTGDLTLAVNGPISASTIVTAGTVNLKTTFSSSVTSINMDLLSSVTEIQSQGTADAINFSSATDVQLGSLAIYTDPLTITTKKGATLDIGSLDDLNAAGTAVDMSLTVSGPKDLTIAGWDDSYLGTITATNIENLTVTGYEGAIVIGNGVENAIVTGGVDVSLSSADDLVSVELTTKLYDDPNVLSTTTAKAAYAGAGKVNDLVFSSANLNSIKLDGYWGAVTSTNNANVTSIDIDATMKALTIDNNDNLATLDVTGSQINDVTFQNNSGIETVVFDHETELNYVGATTDDTDVVVAIVDNEGMTSLGWSATNVQSLTVTGNDKLATVDFTGLDAASSATTKPAIALNVRDNDITVATATDIVDGASTQYAIDGSVTTTGVNDDDKDLGTYGTDGGMKTLKPYLALALLDANASGNVHFDTVITHSIDTAAALSTETAGIQNQGNASTFEGTVANGGALSTGSNNWVGLVWYNLKSSYESTNPTAQSTQKEKRAFVLDVSALVAGTTTISMLISSTDVFEANGTFGDVTIANTGLTAIINQLKTTAAVDKAADLGATLDIYVGANSKMPSVTLKTGSTSAANFEGYTDAQLATLEKTHGVLTMAARVTTYDQFTYTVGGKSVVASITLASGLTSAVGTDATAAVASAIAAAWDSGYGAAGTSDDLVFWGNSNSDAVSGTIGWLVLENPNSGSRAYGQSVSFSHSTKATAAQISLTVKGSSNATYTFIDWIIGTDDKQLASTDNKTTDVDLIISLEETLASGSVINGATAATVTLNSAETLLTELSTTKLKTSTRSTLLAGDIFITDAGIFPATAGGTLGDVRNAEAASDGLINETGSRRAYFSRIHWLSS